MKPGRDTTRRGKCLVVLCFYAALAGVEPRAPTADICYMVKDINQDPGHSNPQNYAEVDGVLFFGADDGILYAFKNGK